MFLSLFLIFTFGILGGLLFDKIRIPKLIWYMFLGILLGPSLLNVIDEELLNISSILRQVALVIILTRSGLSLNVKTLKSIGRPAILMCFIPALFEIIGIVIFGPILLNISIKEALLLGSVLAAVSPAVVVPRMLKLKEEEYGTNNHTPELIMASSSCDDIFVIILFYSFKNIVTSTTSLNPFIEIPFSIILGILLGLIIGFTLILIFKYFKLNIIEKVIIMLALSFGMIFFENALKEYISISSLLGIIVAGILVLSKRPNDASAIQKSYNSLWQGFEILLFVLVGSLLNLSYTMSSDSFVIIILILISLTFRSIGVILCLLKTKYKMREKTFIIISYLPKATVQASIGGIALGEGLSCGQLILTSAVLAILITAPIGAILMDKLYNKLLTKDKIEEVSV